ncbi:DUF945 family protein, partial [Salmonella enterica subsp. enterica serovar Anatum]|nr:DUF945 family protein [Salmonella enterica subsp. enterica serovar Anatum]
EKLAKQQVQGLSAMGQMFRLTTLKDNTIASSLQYANGQITLNEAFVFRVHLVLGMTIFLLFPFTRLVHVWSAPFEYFTRRYQIVR